jgi:predicted RNase H-like HicB family nuclease
MTRSTFTAILEKEGDLYVALCPELDVASQGATVEEATANLKEAVKLFFECADLEEIERATLMNYKSYLATTSYDDEAGIFHGEVVNTQAVITFQGSSVEELHREMAASIGDYLDWCGERGKEPEAKGEPRRSLPQGRRRLERNPSAG